MDDQTIYRRRWLTLLVLCVSLLVIGLDNTILNVALPTLVKDLSASASQLQWIVDSYTIVFACLLLTAGSLGDRFGRKHALTLGLTIFALGSLVSAFAGSASVLIATRALMGVGGAFIMPATLSILTNVFLDPHERAKAIGIWAGVSALGIGLGPVTGGFLLEHFWWGSVFLINVPIVVLGLVAGRILVPDSRDPSAPRLDPVGAGLSIAGLTALLWGIIEAPSHGWTAPEILAAFAVGLAVMAAFVTWELKSSHPMLDVRFFENRRFTAASGAITLTFFVLFGTLFLLTQYLQSVLGYSALKAGAVLLPQAALLMVCASTSNIWVRRFGSKVVVAFGLFVVSLFLVLVGTLPADVGLLRLVLTSMVLAVGMGNVMAPATESIMGSLPRAKAGVGSAVNDTTRQVGGALGVAVLGSLLTSHYTSHMGDFFAGKGLPGPVVSNASDSVGKAVGIAANRDLPIPVGVRTALLDAARHNFTSGMHVSALVAAAVALVAGVMVIVFLPARASDYQAPVAAGPGVGGATELDGHGASIGAEAEVDLQPVAD